MSTEQDPKNTTSAGATAAGSTGAADAELEQQDDLAHGGDEDKAEELEKKAFGDKDGDGEGDAPYVQFPG